MSTCSRQPGMCRVFHLAAMHPIHDLYKKQRVALRETVSKQRRKYAAGMTMSGCRAAV